MTSQFKAYDVIRSPVITEKATLAAEASQVVFNVARSATKPEIKAAVEQLFGVKVKAVNTLVRKGKNRVFRGRRALLADTKMNSYSIAANVKLINVATNEIEAVSVKNAQILGISPENALKAAAQSGKGRVVVDGVMNDVLKKVAERWTSDLVNAGRVQVVVKNVANYGAAKSFKELAEKQLSGETIQQRDVKGGVATFDITVEGGSDTLAAALEGKKAGKYTVEVIEVARGKVILKLN